MPDLPATRLTTATVAIGGSYIDALETRDDRDWIGIDLDAGETVELRVEGTGGGLEDTTMTLFDPLSGTLAYNDDYGSGLGSGLIYTAAVTGRHYVEVAAYDRTETGGYRLTAEAVAPPGPLDGLDWGTQVSDTVVTVYFAPSGTRLDGYTSEGFNAYERARFQEAFDRIEAVSGLNFVVTTNSNADFRLVLDTNEVDGEFLAYFNPPGEFNEGIGVFDGSSWDRSAGGDLEVGGDGFATITHELLHGLGLAHPHDTGGTSSIFNGVTSDFNDYGDGDLNQGIFTTMSYNSGWFTGPSGTRPSFDGNSGREAGPMALDIAMLQAKYGANTSTNSGNNVYTLDATSGAGTAWEAIWDTGGYDEIRANTNADVTINLARPNFDWAEGGGGFVSHVDGVEGGFVIAGGVLIEVARGGNGDDTLIGNVANNVLYGGRGADTMQGGRGNDLYYVGNEGDEIVGEIVYSQGGGVDTVRSYIDYTLGTNLEILRLGFATDDLDINGTGNDAPGVLVGNAGENILTARGGNDRVVAYGGDDTLIGNTGRDTLSGGEGADTFVYNGYADSRAGRDARDFINGFDHGEDIIDLSLVDADTNSYRIDDAYTFIGTTAFSAEGEGGELRVRTLAGQNAIIVEADRNGNGTADLQIFINGTTFMQESDFIL